MMLTRRSRPDWRVRVLIAAALGFAIVIAIVTLYPAVPSRESGVPVTKTILQCTDTCRKAKDGVCDDGRVAFKPSSDQGGPPSVSVKCDLGTDCSDCGPWLGTPVQRWNDEPGPVAFVRSRNKTLRVKLTSTRPPFLQPITARGADPDMSAMLDGWGALEGGVTRTFHEILRERCVEPSGRRALVLDVGAQFGYFALYAAMHGCRVIVWEPVPLFRAYIEYGAQLNNVSHLITMRGDAAAGDAKGGSLLPLGVPKDGTYWGLASINNLNLHKHEVNLTLMVPIERIDDVVPSEEVLLLKIDVEGYEPPVLRGAAQMIKARRVRNVLTEYSPGIAERHKSAELLMELPASLQLLTSAGYQLSHLHSRFATPWPPSSLGYDEPMPPLPRISPESLEYDKQAAALYKSGCAVPKELQHVGPWSGSCHEWAYWAHPKGFRSSFGYNTNLWASIDTDGRQRFEGLASLFAPTQDMKVWTSQLHPNKGVGLLRCEEIGAGHRVLFRCNCTQPACAEEQRLVHQLAAAGKMQMT